MMERISGFLIVVGVLLGVAAMLSSPRVYQETHIGTRMEILSAEHGRWVLSQTLFAVGGLFPALGFALLAWSWRGTQPGWPYLLGAVIFLAGSAAGALFVFLQTGDPATYWEYEGPIPLIVATVILSAVGLGLFGIAFGQHGFPQWLSILMIGVSAGVIVFYLFRPANAFLLTVVLSAVELVTAIVLLIQN